MQVKYVEHMGNDLTVCRAARCSFNKAPEGYTREKNVRLIHYLALHKHFLPFRHPQVTLHLKAPLFVIRQIDKHQVGFSTSEISRRYVSEEPEFYEPVFWRKASEDKKQGSGEVFGEPNQRVFDTNYDFIKDWCETMYQVFIRDGVAPEMARMMLPQSMYTEQVKTGSLLGWFHLYNQRSEEHAQEETRTFAEMIKEQVEPLFPESWKALTEYKE